jgi:hypothetical protein
LASGDGLLDQGGHLAAVGTAKKGGRLGALEEFGRQIGRAAFGGQTPSFR